MAKTNKCELIGEWIRSITDHLYWERQKRFIPGIYESLSIIHFLQIQATIIMYYNLGNYLFSSVGTSLVP